MFVPAPLVGGMTAGEGMYQGQGGQGPNAGGPFVIVEAIGFAGESLPVPETRHPRNHGEFTSSDP
jgi:hypothetical protein